ncbi:hypothetical protein BFP72_08835 [Reichenbachiella sp. 5M10]|uniref:hypothetical protein n=1 Tax=Reichenbachiella sp. 5M10 TaxID=1889772 RepID=UPI000C149E73|nr:hypothetical protein [Reichenbachiella sp. 5M10]PIB35489.1 hypothetical protein BFP72_08835 [Reichenbachiella sp. 5M10]
MKNLLGLLLVFVSLIVFEGKAQGTQEELSETISWLERKINITYYNAQTQEWWSNRFFYNAETGMVNIKNTSSDVPTLVNRKSHYDRKVLLADLDANSILVEDINEDQGRIVYGQVVRVYVIGRQKKIQRTKNGMASFNEFFLQIPVPHTFDSTRQTADSIRTKLALAIELSSKIKPTGDEEQNARKILAMLHGSFKGTDDTRIHFNQIYEHAFEIEHKDGEAYLREGLIGFDEINNNFYLWTISRGKRERLILTIQSDQNIALTSSDEPFGITIQGVNHFTLLESGVTTDFYRSEE